MFKKKSSTAIKSTREDKIFTIVTTIFLMIAVIIVAYPIYFVIIASISDPYKVLNGEVTFYPIGVTLKSYREIFKNKEIWTGYGNSMLYTAVGTLLNVSLTMLIAYPLSRRYFSGRKTITTILLITMYFGGGLIPTYLLIQKMHLYNTFAVMIFLGAVSAYNVIIARTFLENNIPTELEEAAEIDGCSKLTFFFRFVLPLSKSVIAVLVLYYAIAHWNDYMRGLIYLKDTERYPLQLVIRSILMETQVQNMDMASAEELADMFERTKLAEAMKYGIIIISTIPTLVIYPFIQKHFVKGVMIGSVKE